MGQHIIQLSSGTKSAYIDRKNRDTNYGSSQILKVGGKHTSGPYDFDRYKAFIYIPIFETPLYKKILDIKLKIYVTKGLSGESDVAITMLSEEWSDNTITFNNNPSSGITRYSSISPGTGWKSISLSDYIDIWYDKFDYAGFRIEESGSYGSGSWGSDDDEVLEFYSMKASNKPYIEITYEDAVPQAPTNFGPVGKVNRDAVIHFSWTYNSEVGDYQTKFDLQWSSDNGQTWNTITRATSDTFYDMPAGTLPPGTIRVRVRTYDYYGQVSPWSDEIIYKNVAPLTPTDLSPDGLIIDGDLVNRFSWTYNSEIGDTQTKFDLQWSDDNGQTWNTITKATSETFYDMPAMQLPNKTIIWRVRTYGYDGVPGPWSELATVDVYGSPPNPIITTPSVVYSARPTIEWTTDDPQTAYEIQVLYDGSIVWETEETAGAEQNRQIGIDLQAQNYTVRLRYKNNYDRWSNWVEKNITVQYTVPGKPQISIYKNIAKAAIEIIIRNIPKDEPFERNDIYRREYGETEWNLIATGIEQNGSYVDYLVKSEVLYEYMVQTYTTSGGYAASEPIIADIKVVYTILAPIQNPADQIILKYDIELTETHNREKNFMRFVGREKPVAEYGQQKDHGITIRCTIKDKEILDKLIEMLLKDEYLLYRDKKGRYMICSSTGDIQVTEQRKLYKVSFALQEVM